jgi:hypothetical protein
MSTLTRRKVIAITVPTVAWAAASCAPAPAAPPPAPAPAAANKLLLFSDTVQGSKNIPEDARPTKSCVMSNRFPRNAEVVWRAKIFDPATGEGLTDKEATAQINLTNGTTISMRYRPNRNDPSEFFWSGSWVVPKGHTTGTLGYTMVASDNQGRKGEFKPINVPSTQLIITDEELADVPTQAG